MMKDSLKYILKKTITRQGPSFSACRKLRVEHVVSYTDFEIKGQITAENNIPMVGTYIVRNPKGSLQYNALYTNEKKGRSWKITKERTGVMLQEK